MGANGPSRANVLGSSFGSVKISSGRSLMVASSNQASKGIQQELSRLRFGEVEKDPDGTTEIGDDQVLAATSAQIDRQRPISKLGI